MNFEIYRLIRSGVTWSKIAVPVGILLGFVSTFMDKSKGDSNHKHSNHHYNTDKILDCLMDDMLSLQ